MAYIENDDHWIKCNDSRIAEEEFPRDMEGIVVMVMERLNEEDAETAEMEMQNGISKTLLEQFRVFRAFLKKDPIFS